MLRVYSVLYIEKLWNHNLSSDIVKQVPVKATYTEREMVDPVSVSPIEETMDKQEQVLEEEVEEEVVVEEEIVEECQSKEQEIVVEEIEIETTEEETISAVKEKVTVPIPEESIVEAEQMVSEVSSLEEPVIEVAAVEAIQEQEEEVMQVVDDELTIEIVQEAINQDVMEEVIPIKQVEKEEPVEKVVSSLAINTNRYNQISTILESPIEDIYSAGIADHSTSVSTTSSILSPLTPTSVQSSGFHSPSQVLEDIEFEKKVQALPPPQPRKRTTSLFKRETDKINDKRKSLTKKLKRALTVKAENKRYSV
ncbi:hypothetical protein BD560DRAFT_485898 [Blakeslea trispora]|nr:hypothetical protein BD560DRAFT_485898 [Blakeslea trispora]